VENESQRWVGGSILCGALLIGISTLFHPITINPWLRSGNLQKVSETLSFWDLDHWGIAIGFSLWLTGLLAVQAPESTHLHVSRLIRISRSLFTCALAMWLIVIAYELTAIPHIVQAITAHNFNSTLGTVGESLFNFGLLAGYLSVALIWLGILFLSSSRRSHRVWFRNWGIAAGWTGILGIVYTLCWPTHALWVLAITSGIPYLWTVVLGFQLLSRSGANDNLKSRTTLQ
jgi:hypothetical protein